MNVLIIEDSKSVAAATKTITEAEGYKAICFPNGTDALEWLKQNTADLMVVDYNLPDMTGKEFIEKVATRHIPPFIVSTGRGSERVVAEMMRLGAKDYVMKDQLFHEMLPIVIKKAIHAINEEKRRQKAEEELARSERKYRQLLQQSAMAIAIHKIITNEEGKPIDYQFVEANNAFEDFTGLKPENIIGKTVREVLPGIEKSAFDWIGFYGEVALRGAEKEFEQYSEPLKKWYRVHVYSTEKLFFTTMFVDITASKKQTEELEAFFSVNLDLLCIADLEGNFIKTNQAWSRILGYSTEELNQRKFLEYVHPDDMEATLGALAILGKGDDVLEFTNRYKCKDGSYRFIEWRSHPRGNLIYAAARDVTEKTEQERMISNTNRMLQTILDTIPQHVFWKDRNSVYMGCNARGAKVAGVANPLDIMGKTDYDLAWKKEEADFFRACDQRVMANNAPELHIIEPQLQADGKNVWLDTTKIPLHDDSGIVNGILVAFEDITEKRTADQEKLRQAGMIKSLLSSIPDIVFFKDCDGVYLGCNPLFAELVGRKSQEEVIGKTDYDLFDKELAESFKHHDNEMLKQLTSRQNEEEVTFPDGRKVLIDTLKTPYRDSNGNVIGILGISRDITERKKAEDSLRESEVRFSVAVEGTEAGIWDWDMLKNEVVFSVQWKAMLGYKDAEIENSFAGWKNLWHPDDVAAIEKAITDHMNGLTKKYEIVHRCRHKDGDWRWIMTRGKILRNADEKPIRWIGTNIDITYRKRVEEELLQSEQNQRILLDNIQTQIWYLTDETTYGTLNKAHADFNGVKIEDLAFKNLYDIFSKDIVDVCKQSNTEVFSTKKTVHTQEWLPHVSGEKRLVSIIKTPRLRPDGSVEYVVCSAEDVTEQKQSEHTIQEQSELQKILMAVSNEFINIPLNQTDEAVNTALATLGRFTNTDRSYIFHYDHEERVCNNTYEWCGDGIIPQIEQLQGIPFDAVPDWIEAHFAGKPMHIADVMALPSDNGVRQVLEPQGIQSILALPMMDDNNCIGFVGFDAVKRKHIFSDNEQKLLQLFALMLVNIFKRNQIETELTASRQQAEAASKAKSEFLANMSHEIRTPMNSILGFSEIMLNTTNDTKQKNYLKTILNSGQTLLSLINDILDLSKIEAGKMDISYEPVDLHLIISDITSLFSQNAANKNIELITEIDENFPRTILIDEIRLRQILLNITGNAIKFTNRGYVKITLLILDISNETLSFEIIVEDTGIGIAPQQQKLIFESFRQASGQDSRQYSGTGLGLSISKKLVELMNGEIHLASEPGKGSTFSIVFKNINYYASSEEKHDGYMWDEKILDFNNQKVLVVDDVAYNRQLVVSYLENSSLLIYEAENGMIAIEAARNYRPDLILMDIRMPVMDGYQATEIIKNDPALKNIPVVALTASTMKSQNEDPEKLFNGILHKPIKKQSLIHTLTNHLKHKKTKTDTLQPNDNSIEAVVTPHSGISEKIIEMFNNQLAANIEDHAGYVILDELDTLIGHIKEFSVKHKVNALEKPLEKLKHYRDDYDLKNIQETLHTIKNLFR